MNTDTLERGIADVYEHEAPPRAPEWLLGSVLDAIDATPQRRVLIRAPWRTSDMNSFAKLAIAAVVVIAIGAVGLSVLGPRSPSGVGGPPSASPVPSVSPTPSPSADPSPPPLSKTFTSATYGISLAYPEGWATKAGTDPWTGGGISFPNPDVDYMYDGLLTSDLFIAVASQPLAGKAGATWVTELINDPESDCPEGGTPIMVDGASGSICHTLVALSTAKRGYLIRLYISDDHPSLVEQYDRTWFQGLLATVRLHPADAVDGPAASSTPGPS